MSLWFIAAAVAYFIKGMCGFANTLVFTSVLSFGTANSNISPIDLLLDGEKTHHFLRRRGKGRRRWFEDLRIAADRTDAKDPGKKMQYDGFLRHAVLKSVRQGSFPVADRGAPASDFAAGGSRSSCLRFHKKLLHKQRPERACGSARRFAADPGRRSRYDRLS